MDNKRKKSGAALTLAALGIVYGDIGTSPLYTLKEVFSPAHGLPLNEATLLGVISLILWGLTIVVSLKYVVLVLRADNRGEGGIIALVALALESAKARPGWQGPLALVGLMGAALFFGDGVITPAISVLSAFEGLEVAAPGLRPYVVPATVAVLLALYALQHKGTAGIGRWFGPVILIWFVVIGFTGAIGIAHNPRILEAINPVHAFRFLTGNGWLAFLALGAVVLAFTGAEALYADMGHLGKRWIRLAWSTIVFPGLALNYLGQGALLLSRPEAVSNPFYGLSGGMSLYPLIALATLATIIASQATISGTFSITRQAIALGYLPRMRIVYTSEREIGQIYIPFVNWLQFCAVLVAVIGFGSSSHLASAYGIAVTATMLMTTILSFVVVRFGWRYNDWLAWGATSFFLLIDIALFSANTLKILHGGWFSLLLAAGAALVMLTWRQGRALVSMKLRQEYLPLEDFLNSLFIAEPARVAGTAVFFRSQGDGVPHALLHNLMHNRVLHQQTILLTIHNRDVPRVSEDQRASITDLGHDFYQVDLHYGFMEDRDIPSALLACSAYGLRMDPMQTSFFIARQNVIPRLGKGMAIWRETLFAAMSRNARHAADYYRIPSNRVVELGAQVEI